MKPRTRFAPSPTGYLHIGGARTALYNWLYARRHNGTFILRIEDTDKARSTDENTKAILDGLKWLGLSWDEGPILQSTRYEIYREHAERLLSMGKAYRCYCTKEELDAKRALAEKEKRPYRYDRTCRNPATRGPRSGPFVVRVAFDESGETHLKDLVKGDVSWQNEQLSDEVILREDGSPLYNFCVVIDDADMKISHVLRGDDHLNNTHKQIQLYKAFGWELPKFGHLPLIFGPDKKKLSKRNNVVAVDAYDEMGYLPEAMINFLARIGWAHGDEETFTLARLTEIFDVEGIGKSAGIYDIKKLEFLGNYWIKQKTNDELKKILLPRIEKKGWKAPPDAVFEQMIVATKERSKTLVEMLDQVEFWFVDEPAYDPKAVEKSLKGKGELIDAVREAIAGVQTLDNAHVEEAMKSLAEKRGAKLGEVGAVIRVGATGKGIGAPFTDITTLLGKERVTRRLEKAKTLA